MPKPELCRRICHKFVCNKFFALCLVVLNPRSQRFKDWGFARSKAQTRHVCWTSDHFQRASRYSRDLKNSPLDSHAKRLRRLGNLAFTRRRRCFRLAHWPPQLPLGNHSLCKLQVPGASNIKNAVMNGGHNDEWREAKRCVFFCAHELVMIGCMSPTDSFV